MSALVNVIRWVLTITVILMIGCAEEYAEFTRDNPIDPGGENWHPPSVTLTADETIALNDSITIIALGTDENGTVKYYVWAIDADTYSDTTMNGTYTTTFSSGGKKIIRVRVIDDDGVVSPPESCIVTVMLGAPSVSIQEGTHIRINDSLIITAAAVDSNGKVTAFVWAIDSREFSDTTDSGIYVVSFSDSGEYVVYVRAIDDDGEFSGIDSCIIEVVLSAPSVTVEEMITVDINDSCTINALATDSNGIVEVFIWSFDDKEYRDTTVTGALRTAFSDSGEHLVYVRVMNDDGVVSPKDSCVVMVQVAAPVITTMNDTVVNFADINALPVTVAASDTNVGGTVGYYLWSTGAEGWSDTTDTPEYTVVSKEGGLVTVRWAAQDDDGLITADTFTVLFNRPPDTATFTLRNIDSWGWYSYVKDMGVLMFDVDFEDPDLPADSITYTLTVGFNDSVFSRYYTENEDSLFLDSVAPGDTIYYRLIGHDRGGDSAVSSGVVIAPSAPLLQVVDYDGNAYPVIVLGNQIWTTVNLRVTHYSDGTPIAYVSDNLDWSIKTSGAYCFYSNTSDGGKREKYGALYNWYAVATGKLAPDGWRVPTAADWYALEQYLIGNGYNWDGSTYGNKVAKALAATTDWNSYNSSGAIGNDLSLNNSSGFSALPGGLRYGTLINYMDINKLGFWWTSTEYSDIEATAKYLRYSEDSIGTDQRVKGYGFSVRIVRDLY